MIRRRKIGDLAGGTDRKHLTSRQVEQLLEATKGGRNAARDRCLLLLMFRHGLRVSEACRMKLDQVDGARGSSGCCTCIPAPSWVGSPA
jgi:integrase